MCIEITNKLRQATCMTSPEPKASELLSPVNNNYGSFPPNQAVLTKFTDNTTCKATGYVGALAVGATLGVGISLTYFSINRDAQLSNASLALDGAGGLGAVINEVMMCKLTENNPGSFAKRMMIYLTCTFIGAAIGAGVMLSQNNPQQP